MSEYLGREFHRRNVGDAYDPKKRTPEEEKKLEAQRKSERKFTLGNKEYPDKGKDAEPVAAGEEMADADLIPIDDAEPKNEHLDPQEKEQARQRAQNFKNGQEMKEKLKQGKEPSEK